MDILQTAHVRNRRNWFVINGFGAALCAMIVTGLGAWRQNSASRSGRPTSVFRVRTLRPVLINAESKMREVNMSKSSRELRSRCIAITSAASAAVVIAGLVAVTPEPRNALGSRVEFAAVQLQSVETTDVSAILGNARPSATTSSKPSGAAAAAVGPALLAITVPLWFAAFPITIPISVVFWTAAALRNPTFAGNPINAIIFGVRAGLSNWFSAPLPLVFAFGAAASASRTTAAIQARATTSQPPTASASRNTTRAAKTPSRGAAERSGGVPRAARTAVAPNKAAKAVASAVRNGKATAREAVSQANRRADRA